MDNDLKSKTKDELIEMINGLNAQIVKEKERFQKLANLYSYLIDNYLG